MAIDTSAGAEPFEGADVRAVTVQPVADPAPLGLAAFAMTTFALSIANTNVWGAGAFAALGLALVYGGLAQLLAGMWEFVRKNTFGAVAFTSYGAFWITYYVLVKFVVPGVPIRNIPVMLGVFTLGWTIFTAYMTVASLRVSAAVALVFILLTITFVLLTIANFNLPYRHHQGGRMVRCRHCGCGLVCIVCWGDERDVQKDHPPGSAVGPEGELSRGETEGESGVRQPSRGE